MASNLRLPQQEVVAVNALSSSNSPVRGPGWSAPQSRLIGTTLPNEKAPPASVEGLTHVAESVDISAPGGEPIDFSRSLREILTNGLKISGAAVTGLPGAAMWLYLHKMPPTEEGRDRQQLTVYSEPEGYMEQDAVRWTSLSDHDSEVHLRTSSDFSRGTALTISKSDSGLCLRKADGSSVLEFHFAQAGAPTELKATHYRQDQALELEREHGSWSLKGAATPQQVSGIVAGVHQSFAHELYSLGSGGPLAQLQAEAARSA